jgi:acetyl-CoA C-acetyltransferase
MNDRDVFVVSARRTPIGSYLGQLADFSAPELGARALSAALDDARVPRELVEQVYLGNVLSAGIGQAPARQASLGAGLSAATPTTTVSKVCGSGLEAVILGVRAIRLGEADVAATGGMESMSRAPHYLTSSRRGYRLGDGKLVDGMIHDGLWDPYQDLHMGEVAEACATKYDLSRAAQDEFAKESYRRAGAAQASGAFARELVSVERAGPKGAVTTVSEDEEPGRGDPAKFDRLRPAFRPDGTITAANASSLNDGAAALVLASGRKVRELGLEPLARVLGHAAHAQEPEWFTTAPVGAIQKALQRAELTTSDIDLFEVNEAFACVALACARLADIDPERLNVNGGAVALGHPIGASGARILTTLLHALRARGKRRGVASLCIGGGEAVAMVVEAV